jgi:Secretion system C-terminal sorting domain
MYYKISVLKKNGSVIYSRLVSIGSTLENFVCSAYPTVATDELILQINAQRSYETQIRIINLQGQVLQTKTVNIPTGSTSLPLNVDHLPVGAYMIEVYSQNKLGNVVRFFKQ